MGTATVVLNKVPQTERTLAVALDDITVAYSVLQKSVAKTQAFGERYRFAQANQINNLK